MNNKTLLPIVATLERTAPQAVAVKHTPTSSKQTKEPQIASRPSFSKTLEKQMKSVQSTRKQPLKKPAANIKNLSHKNNKTLPKNTVKKQDPLTSAQPARTQPPPVDPPPTPTAPLFAQAPSSNSLSSQFFQTSDTAGDVLQPEPIALDTTDLSHPMAFESTTCEADMKTDFYPDSKPIDQWTPIPTTSEINPSLEPSNTQTEPALQTASPTSYPTPSSLINASVTLPQTSSSHAIPLAQLASSDFEFQDEIPSLEPSPEPTLFEPQTDLNPSPMSDVSTNSKWNRAEDTPILPAALIGKQSFEQEDSIEPSPSNSVLFQPQTSLLIPPSELITQAPMLNIPKEWVIESPMDSNQWLQEMGDKLLWIADRDIKSAFLAINPPDLGPLQVQLSLQSGEEAASIHFMTQHWGVKQALEEGMPKLKELMQQQGLELLQVQVSTDSSSQQSHQQSLFQSNDWRQSHSNHASTSDEKSLLRTPHELITELPTTPVNWLEPGRVDCYI